MRWASAWGSRTTTATEQRRSTLLDRLAAPVDAAALASFRILFGALLLVAVVRYVAGGTFHEVFIEPRHFFPLIRGLGPLPAPGMHLVFTALGVAAACLTLGLFTRAAAASFCVLFSYAHFADLTHYLNHYYLVTLLTGLMAVLPVARIWSVDAARAPAASQTVPAWTLWLLRFQVGCVYFFGGIAKLKSDWLVTGAPLRMWLPANGDLPLVGPLLVRPEAALPMSWAGAAFDLCIPFLLLWRRTRPLAYVAVAVFHLLTAALFRLGMFPYFMIAGSLLFLPPGWARRFARDPLPAQAAAGRRPGAVTGAALLLFATFQLTFPLRHHLFGRDVLWTERGFRFSWNVMLMEKTGVADFTTRDRRTGAERPVRVSEYLTPLQAKTMSTQPDLLRDFARLVRAGAAAEGRDVAVFADVLVSLNGRPPARLIAAGVDLAAESLAPGWILPLPAPERGYAR